MVNIRRTLDVAKSKGVIEEDAYWATLAIAKKLFYRDRTYAHILENLKDMGFLQAAGALEAWIPLNRQDLKRQDAILLLQTMSQPDMPMVATVPYEFQDTEFWRTMKKQIDDEVTHEH